MKKKIILFSFIFLLPIANYASQELIWEKSSVLITPVLYNAGTTPMTGAHKPIYFKQNSGWAITSVTEYRFDFNNNSGYPVTILLGIWDGNIINGSWDSFIDIGQSTIGGTYEISSSKFGLNLVVDIVEIEFRRGPLGLRLIHSAKVDLKLFKTAAESRQNVMAIKEEKESIIQEKVVKTYIINQAFGTIIYRGKIDCINEEEIYAYRARLSISFDKLAKTNQVDNIHLKEINFRATKLRSDGPVELLHDEMRPISITFTAQGEMKEIPIVTFRLKKTVADEADFIAIIVSDGNIVWPLIFERK